MEIDEPKERNQVRCLIFVSNTKIGMEVHIYFKWGEKSQQMPGALAIQDPFFCDLFRQFAGKAYTETVPSAACLPLTTWNTLQFPQLPAFTGALKLQLSWPRTKSTPNYSMQIPDDCAMIALCALVLGLLEIFCGNEKNPPVVTTAWLSSSGL